MNTINIPKFANDDLIEVKIQRGGVSETPKALKVRCVKQEIKGVTIPNGYEIWIPGLSTSAIHNTYSMSPTVHVPGYKINEILRTMIIDQLKAKK